MFSIEEWQVGPDGGGWVLVLQGVPEEEREGLMEANLASGNVYSDEDPMEMPATGSVFRFVDQEVLGSSTAPVT